MQLKLLKVDLSKLSLNEEVISDDIVEKFIGGRGLGVKLLMDGTSQGIDPLSPENKLIFLTGPATGTKFPSSGRFHIITKSPLTGAVGDSNCGGNWGPELRFSGYDGIVITGKAEEPTFLLIKDGNAELQSAKKYWGKTVWETEDMLHDDLKDPKAKIVSIGPAGENLVLFASIMNKKHRAAGRGGIGAVMGSKNLKAIVVRGNGDVLISDPEGLTKTRKEMIEKLKSNSITGHAMRVNGTSVLVDLINEAGILPTRNFQTGLFAEAQSINADKYKEDIYKKHVGCWGCSIACGRISAVSRAPYQVKGEGPEYESIALLGASCGISDAGSVAKASNICDEMGMDTISFGGTVACAMELAKKGKIPEQKLDGLLLDFGNPQAIVELAWRTAYRIGFGADIALGSKRLAEKYDLPEAAMQVKGLELPGYDPRGAKGQGLAYATSPRGACHLRSYTIAPEIASWPEKIDPFEIEGKESWVKAFQEVYAVMDSLVVCKFLGWALDVRDLAELTNKITGWDWEESDLMKCGERIWNLERAYLIREGFSRKDDTLPKRFLVEPMPEGPAKGQVVELNEMLEAYYSICGWDRNGKPKKSKMEELGLEEYYLNQE